jgi:hypothetical protein
MNLEPPLSWAERQDHGRNFRKRKWLAEESRRRAGQTGLVLAFRYRPVGRSFAVVEEWMTIDLIVDDEPRLTVRSSGPQGIVSNGPGVLWLSAEPGDHHVATVNHESRRQLAAGVVPVAADRPTLVSVWPQCRSWAHRAARIEIEPLA